MQSPIFVIGHKNPDNDSIASAVGYAYLKNELAKRAAQEGSEEVTHFYKPFRLGPLPAESAWVLGEYDLEAPELLECVPEGQNVVLVDHNERHQAVTGLENAHLLEVVDHHRVSLTTTQPIQYINMPWGSTATIVAAMFRTHNVEIPQGIAAVLLSAILTDTIITKSPTCTQVDKDQIAYLSKISGLEMAEFGKHLFELRGGEDKMTIEKLVGADSKEFEVAGKMVLIAQRETVNLKNVMGREDEMRAHMRSLVAAKGYDFVLLLVTDIMAEGSQFLVEGNPETVERVFGFKSAPGGAWLPGVLSRKKQVAAPLLEA